MSDEMNPVKENRAYIKGRGACVNVDESAYTTRITRLNAQKAKDVRVSDLENQVSNLTELVQQLLAKG